MSMLSCWPTDYGSQTLAGWKSPLWLGKWCKQKQGEIPTRWNTSDQRYAQSLGHTNTACWQRNSRACQPISGSSREQTGQQQQLHNSQTLSGIGWWPVIGASRKGSMETHPENHPSWFQPGWDHPILLIDTMFNHQSMTQVNPLQAFSLIFRSWKRSEINGLPTPPCNGFRPGADGPWPVKDPGHTWGVFLKMRLPQRWMVYSRKYY